MTALELLSQLRELGIRVTANGDRLHVNAPQGALTNKLREAIARHKPELLDLLLSRPLPERATAIERVSREAPMPLSFAQQRLWFLEQMEGQLTAYNMPFAWRLQGPLHREALRRALEATVRRHEVLRTTYASTDEGPVQLIGTVERFELPWDDLSSFEAGQQEMEIVQRCWSEAERPFDLTSDLMLRGSLLRLADEEHVLLLTMHHIASDGWTLGVLWRELELLYDAYCRDKDAELPKLPVQYADYAAWQRSETQGRKIEQLLQYWHKQLDGVSSLELPTDRPRPPAFTYQGARHDFELKAELVDRLKALGKVEGVTLHMTLLAAFQTLLSRYSGQEDVAVGTPIAGRNHTELEDLLGFFVNTLVMRTDLSGNPTFRELLDRVRQVSLAAYDHQDLPFERLVEELQPERSLDRNPLVQVMFQLLSFPDSDLALREIEASRLPMASQRVRFDLEMHLWQQPKDIRGAVVYATDLFDPSTIQRMVGHFIALLQEVVADAGRPIGVLPLLTEPERRKLLTQWNGTATAYPRDKRVHELFEQQAEQTSDAVAVVYDDRQLNYRELNERANQLAHHLHELGVGPDVMVGLCAERGIEMVTAMLAILKAGGAYVPLDPDYPASRLSFMIADTKMPVLLAQRNLVDGLEVHGAQVVWPDNNWANLASYSVENLDHGHKLTADHLAYVIYTSGSTGIPKGTAVPHRAVVRLVVDTDYVQIQASDRVAQASNASFDAATFEVWGTLLNGGCLVGIERDVALSPRQFAAALRDRGITTLFMTTALFNQMAREVPGCFKTLRHLLFGGEACDPAFVRRVLMRDPPQRLLHVYGPTENTTFSTWHLVQHVAENATSVPIGKPIANTTVYVLDQNMQPCPVGVPGELYTGGDGLARGYLHQAELTAQKFVADPFDTAGARLYKTGDQCRWLEDGAIEFIGRQDHQVKLRGFRVELGEIEAALNEHAAVTQSVAMLREDSGDSRLVAYVVPDAHAADLADDQPNSKQHIDQWLELYDQTFDEVSAESTGSDFNITGWNSSYTGEAIPAEQMADWVDATVARIRRYRPNRVLEIGCGTGLLLARLAPSCGAYLGTDFSTSVRRQLERLIASRDDLQHVEFSQRLADDFTDIEPQSCDTVIINSVTQYLPSIEYLVTVLEGAVRALTPGGRIFVGDVRSLPLLKAYHASVQWHRAKDSVSGAQLLDRIVQSMDQEGELVIAPAFFRALQTHAPRISDVDVMIKRGGHQNELTRFRYDVFLHVESPVEPAPVDTWLDWQAESCPQNIQKLRRKLSIDKPWSLEMRGIPNARLATEVRLLSRLSDENFASEDVGSLRASWASDEWPAVDPQALWDLADELGYLLEMRDAGEVGHLEALFRRRDANDDTAWQACKAHWPRQETVEAHVWSLYANNPLKGKLVRDLVPRLRDHTKERLPEYMVPSSFVLLDRLPLNPNGKVDRKALPAPGQTRDASTGEFVAPRNELEQTLANIWAELLRFDRVGIQDNFFDLGGHSLLATQVINRLRESFQIELPLAVIFDHPTVAELAAQIEAFDATDHRLAAPIVHVPRDGELPLSFAQQRLWFLEQMEGELTAYNMPFVWRLRGALDRDALRRALEAIVRRHESLRTTFALADGKPVQVIGTLERFELPVENLGSLEPAQAETKIAQHCRWEAERPFDLTGDLMLRASVMCLKENEHVLLLTMHHIASDGWSLHVLWRELEILYDAYCRGANPDLPDLPVQYADYAVWQRSELQGARLEGLLRYWRQQLDGVSPLEIPTDHARPPVPTYHGDWHRFEVHEELIVQLKSLCQTEGVTLHMTLLAAFQALLSRLSGQDDIAVGTPVAGRNQADLEDQIGFFVNTLVLRTDLSEDPTFRELLDRVRQVSLAAFDHQDLPFEQLVGELQPERDLSRSPLVQVLFQLLSFSDTDLALADVEVTRLPSHSERVRFDLEMHLWQQPTNLRGAVVYSTDLFDASTIERMVGHFLTLLEAVVADADQRLSELPLLTEPERHQLLVEWNDTSVEYPRQKCVHQLFEEQVRKTPDTVAVLFEGQHVTYRQLNKQANQLAHHLRGLGVRPESLVGICLERSLDMVVGILGIQKAGGAYLPLEPELPKTRLEFMLQDAAVDCLVTRHPLLSQLPALNCHIVCLDADKTTLSHCQSANPKTEVDEKNLAYVMYTSGSTGRPKGVAIRHGSVVNLLTAIRPVLKIRAGTRLLGIASPTFDISVAEMFLPLVAGGTAILVSEQTARDTSLLTQTIVASQPHIIQATPATWSSLLDSGWSGSGDSDLISTGEALPEAVGKRLLKLCRRLWDFYGPTETTIWSTIRTVTSERIAGSIGRPIANTSVYILDRQQQPVPVGVFGELYVGGAGLARGYLNRPELTAEKFVSHPFSDDPSARLYRTGDLCRWLADGTLELVGRIDHQVKLRGFRIELGEIEALLREHPSVAQCIVTLREDRPGGKRLVAYCLPVAAGNLNFTELARYLKHQLPNYMLPAAFVALDALPLTPSGKIDRRALPAPDYARPELEASHIPPRNPLEEQLTSIWLELLGVERIGVHDNFFSLGGHSLLAAQLVSRLRLTFQVELPLSTVFEKPTVDGLAETIAQARQSSEGMTPLPPIEPVLREQALPLSFAQQRLWFLDQLGAGAAYNMPLQLRRASRIDECIVRRVLMAVANRHETLRTTFGIDDGRPYLRIAPALETPLEIVDLAELSIEAAERECMRLACEQLVQPFDLAQGPLVRALLVRMRHEDALSIAIHHSICDGWSLRLLQEEITEHYRAFSIGGEPQLPALPIQYADYAVWQNRWLDDDALRPQMAYWQRQLGDQLPVLDLPTDRPRPMAQTFGGASRPLDIPSELCRDLTQFNRERGVTMATTLLAVFKLLLARYARQEDIVVGSPIAGRTRIEIEGLIGFFVNSLVLRTDLSGDLSFEAALERVHRVALEGYDHQDVPFERLVDVLAPERDLTQNPLFQVVFAMQYLMEQPDDLAGSDPALNFRFCPIDVTVTRTDIELHLFQQGDRISGRFVYNTALFDASTIGRMADHYLRLIQSAIANPTERVSRLKLLSDDERRQLLTEWNRTDTPFPEERCIHELFEATVRDTPDATALIFENRRMTYGQLNAVANQVAHTLRKMGVKPDALIGLCVERCPEMIVGLLGILKAGGAYVPIDPGYPRERLAFMLGDSATTVLVTQAHLVETLPEHSAQCLCLDRDGGAIAAAPTGNPELVTSPQNLAYVIYTSGSTGRPKGTMLAHRGLVSLSEEQARRFGVDASSRVLQFSSLSFDASTFEVMMALPKGATLVLGDRQALLPGPDLHRFIKERRVSIITVPPTVLAALPEEELPDLATITVAGEACSAELVSRWAPGRRFFNLYGPTEATIWSTIAELRAGEASHIGRPIGNVTTYVLDSQGEVVPVGVSGELYIGGIGVARGYLGRPDLTAERFVPDPFSGVDGGRLYRSGDVVRRRPDGNLEFLGRIDDQVKLRGYRIELGEIEAVLDEHPAVRESVVVVREVGEGDRRLVAYVRCEEDVELVSTETDVSQWQKDHVTQWQSVYDQSYATAEEPAEAAFQISGWNSSYTGEAIPASQMRAWVDETVASIRATGAERVLELGCGSGLMLLNLVGSCAEYYASDFSQPALDYIAAQLARMPAQAPNVVLECRTAEDFCGIPAGHFDTVVLNSVVQYFPDAAYLREVLTNAARTVRPGGRVFVGDVRSLPLMDAFHASVQLFRAPGETSREQLWQRVRHERNQDQELVVDPLFFTRLAAELGSITHVEMRPKRGRYDNELSRFRYDVVLHVGEPGSVPATELGWRPWSAPQLTLERLRAILEGQGPETLALSSIPNRRVARDQRIVTLLQEEQRHETAAELLIAADAVASEGAAVEPEDLWDLAGSLGYDAYLSVANGRSDGSFDAVLAKRGNAVSAESIWAAMPVHEGLVSGAPVTNRPLRGRFLRELVPHLRKFAVDRLPDYMVPSVFTVLDAFPVTPSGKVDRRALPTPDSLRPELTVEYEGPRSVLEETLARIWMQVLGVDRVGVRDNFFELGGDSMLSIQVVAAAREAGIGISARSLFEHQTVEDLAAAAGTPVASAEQGAVSGEMLPTPIASWFFEHELTDRHHFNQAFLLDAAQPFDRVQLEDALGALVEHHDALRLRARGTDAGWQQTIAAPGEPLALEEVDVSGVPADEFDARVETEATRVQGSLDLFDGPILRCALLHCGAQGGDKLLIAIHHLAVDVVSWGVLLDDLARGLEQRRSGAPVRLPAKTTSIQEWARRVNEYARSADVARDARFWLEQPWDRVRALSVDVPDGQNTIGTVRTVSCALEDELTHSVLHEIPAAFNATVEDVLLAALAFALASETGSEHVVFDLEGHGREEFADDLDVSRTVGWFTAIHPVLLEVPRTASAGAVLRSVKEQLRAVPGKGFAFGLARYLSPERALADRLAALPRAEVVFNYLGNLDRMMAQQGNWTASVSGVGASRSPRAERTHLLEVTASVLGGRLEVNFDYSTGVHREETVRRLADRYRSALKGFTDAARSGSEAGFTESDLAEVGWNAEDVEELLVDEDGGRARP